MRKLSLLFITNLIFILSAAATDFKFETFQQLDFLPTKEIKCLFNDNQGFIWIGSSNGVFRYDGYETKIYKSDYKSADLLTDNTINCIVEDKEDNIWIGTNKGLNRIDKKTGIVHKVENERFENIQISSIIVTRRNEIFIGTDRGLIQYSWEDDSCKTLSGMSDGYAIIPNVIKGLYEDTDGYIWIGSWSEGVVKYDPVTGRIYGFPRLGKRNSAHTIFEDARGNIWIGTWGEGVYKVKNDLYGRFVGWDVFPFEKGNPNSLLDDVVYCINEDKNNNTIWVGTRGGLSIITEKEEGYSVKNYNPDGANNSLAYNEVNTIIRDKQGVMWLGMLGGGINFVKTDRPAFNNDYLKSYKEKFYSNSVRSIYKDKNNDLWFGLGSVGLGCKNSETGKENFYTDIDDFKNLSLNTTINKITSSKDGNTLWFSTHGQGVFEYDRKGKKIRKLYAVNNSDMEWICVYDLLVDPDGKYWFATKFGLYLYYPDKKQLYPVADWDMVNYTFSSLSLDSKGRLWAATSSHGVFCVENFALGEKSPYRKYNISNEGISSNKVVYFFLDSKERLWAGTDGSGISFYDEKNDRFASMSDYMNFPTDFVTCIEEDRNGFLWLGTNIGLVQFLVNEDNFSKSNCRIFTIYDGLVDNIFNSTCFKSDDGELFFGTHNGYVSFYPEQIEAKVFSSPIEVTNFKFLGKNWDKMEAKEKNRISLLSPEYTDEIVIPHNKNNFHIEFAALSFVNAEKNKYCYKLEGFDKDWQDVPFGMHSATYNNLPAGAYKFRLMASNQNGIWTERDKKLTIVIEPKPWRTWWAYSIYLLAMIILCYITFRIVRNRIALRNEIKLKEIESANAEEISQAKLMFFTNITHELLTPLTIISASVDELKLIEPKYQKQYQVMLNNVNRLIRLLQQILEFRKADSGNLKLKVSRGDIVSFIKSSVESISPLLKKKDISYTFISEISGLDAYFDIDKLDKILYNLLSNAAKYNDTGNKVQVIFESENDGNIAIIKVKDNGKGFTPESMNKLFERFYEGDHRRHKTMGTGIGLSLTKNLVELHGGTILVESEPDKGACFIVRIPVSRDAFNPEEIDDSILISDNNLDSFKNESLNVNPDENEETDKKTILIVEDNEDLKNLMVGILSLEYKIVTAANGIEALEMINNEDISLIVSDVMMPEMDGIEFTRKMKATLETSHIPIILLTAKNSENDRIEAYNIGADGFIGKPFNVNVLLAKIKNLMKSKEFHAKDFKKKVEFKAKEFDYTSIDEAFIQKAIDCMHKHLDDPDFDQNRFIEEMSVTKSTLYRKLKSLTGMNTSAFMRNIRLKAACTLLIEKKNIRISELAYAVGFSDPKYFTASFKKEFGVLPKDYVASLEKDKETEKV